MQSHLRLIRQTMTNFKGTRSFCFSPNGNDVEVCGANATGKTTLLDGFLWLLFDKDSAGRKEFAVKTQDAEGRALPMLDHSVELVLDKDGEQLTLRKTLSESWVRARGAASATFSGHRVAYEIDGVPRQRKEFDAAVGRLCDEGVLRLLVDPAYFAAKLPWQQRRGILLDLCGEPDDAEVIAADGRLQAVPALLAGRSLEERRKQIAVRKTLLNEELRMVPVRLDEVSRSLPEVLPLTTEKLAIEQQAVREALAEAETELQLLSDATRSAGSQLRLQELSARLLQLENEAESRRQLAQRCTDCRARLGELATEEAELTGQLAEKRRLWNEVEASSLTLVADERCPSCGQALPTDQLLAARDKAQQDFDNERKRRLAEITEQGTALAARQQRLSERRQQQEGELAALQQLQQQSGDVAEQAAQIESLRLQRQTLQQQIAANAVDTQPARQELLARQTECRRRLEQLACQLAAVEQQAIRQQRIEELRRREQTLADEYAELERQTFLTEQFMRVKVGLLEARINSRFKLARFRLFEQQVNGALGEVCEVLGPDGAPYNGGLNNAARINIGIDIINTLSEHYGITAPLFIDNAEAVSQLIDTPCQLIRLVVSESDAALRVTLAPNPQPINALSDAPASAELPVGPGF
jgi:DNA repair exonuclease SbcCD ATPase subunit